MLVDIIPSDPRKRYSHLAPDALAEVMRELYPAVQLTEQKGVAYFGCWNPEMFINNTIIDEYPRFSKPEWDDEWGITMSAYGVCDDYSQVLERYGLEEDPRKFIVALVKITRADQPPRDGWRFHKWGPYIGRHTITHEYLYDETAIDEVSTFHIYEVA